MRIKLRVFVCVCVNVNVGISCSIVVLWYCGIVIFVCVASSSRWLYVCEENRIKVESVCNVVLVRGKKRSQVFPGNQMDLAIFLQSCTWGNLVLY